VGYGEKAGRRERDTHKSKAHRKLGFRKKPKQSNN